MKILSQPRASERRSIIPPSAESAILDAIRSVQYGSVEITIHASQVVQIECKKKIRFQPQEFKES
jgi:hypothetical protein